MSLVPQQPNRNCIVVLLCLHFLVLLYTACDLTKPEDYDPDYTPEISVFGLLSPEPRFTFVVVERTMRIGERDYGFYGDGARQSPDTIIKDARVRILSAQDTVRFSFHQDTSAMDYWFGSNYRQKGLYLDLENKLGVEPGVTYHLLIETADGRVVRGTTRIPGPARILSHADYDTLSYRPETVIKWQDDPNTAAFQMHFYKTCWGHNWQTDREEWIGYNLASDYMYTEPYAGLEHINDWTMDWPGNTCSDTAAIKIMSMDRNYYDFIRTNTGLAEISGTQLELLDGGVGVFGSVNFYSTRVIIESP